MKLWYSVEFTNFRGATHHAVLQMLHSCKYISYTGEALRAQHAINCIYIYICIAHNYKASFSSPEEKGKGNRSIKCTNTLASAFCQNIVYRTVLLLSYYVFSWTIIQCKTFSLWQNYLAGPLFIALKSFGGVIIYCAIS